MAVDDEERKAEEATGALEAGACACARAWAGECWVLRVARRWRGRGRGCRR